MNSNSLLISGRHMTSHRDIPGHVLHGDLGLFRLSPRASHLMGLSGSIHSTSNKVPSCPSVRRKTRSRLTMRSGSSRSGPRGASMKRRLSSPALTRSMRSGNCSRGSGKSSRRRRRASPALGLCNSDSCAGYGLGPHPDELTNTNTIILLTVRHCRRP